MCRGPLNENYDVNKDIRGLKKCREYAIRRVDSCHPASAMVVHLVPIVLREGCKLVNCYLA